MKSKNYILSQRVTYLGLGAAVGFLFALNEYPLNYIMTGIFILITVVLSYYFNKKIN